MSDEILYYLIIFGSVILVGLSMLVLGLFTIKGEKRKKIQ